ncbi:MAG TPA: GNVR domain-containing protein [Terracidiphilus sp.]|nr:GNVR domain-containing protein [Terracidiphilus sp.]
MPIDLQTDTAVVEAAQAAELQAGYHSAPRWLYNLHVLWLSRSLLTRITGVAFVVSVAVAFIIPKMYTSQAQIMPPEMSGTNPAMFAALAQRATNSDILGGLALSLLGGHNNGALFVNLLQSASVSSRLIDQFHLLSVYHKRYHVDAAKVLARRTRISQDKKSGVLTVSVQDTGPVRARDLAQAYLDELNILVTRTSRSSAHQERVFIEKRLVEVKNNLSRAQEALSEFSSSHTAVDLKEQARATVESEARVQGELIAEQSELDALEQMYGNDNVRIHTTQARIASLKNQMEKMGGSSAPLPPVTPADADAAPAYLPLRQVPRLAVPYANLYREVQVQETVYNLLTQQYEIARIQEAKDVPIVNIIDAPGIPEKKSFPPRTILVLALTLVAFIFASFVQLSRHHWLLLDPLDPRRQFAREVAARFGPLRDKMRKSRERV